MKEIKQIGTDSSNFIGGTVGNESIWSVAGWDTLYGYSDNDLLVGGTGGDHINGGAANDSLHLLYSIFYKITILFVKLCSKTYIIRKISQKYPDPEDRKN